MQFKLIKKVPVVEINGAERDRPYWWSRSGGVVMAMPQRDSWQHAKSKPEAKKPAAK